MKKLVIVNQTSQKLNEKNLQKLCLDILSILKLKRLRKLNRLKQAHELVLVFLTSKQMQSVNLKFRSKNKPTDVLSFSSEDPEVLGELLFCIDVLKKQSKQQKQTLQAEFAYMLIHGVLHLLGYDHELSKKEEKVMFTLQDRVFAEVCKQLKLDSKTNIFKT